MAWVETCKTCGKAYWYPPGPGEPEHVCAPKPEVVSHNVSQPVKPDVANADMANSYRYRDPEKRRAYMREYMRKRRARG